jgi:hypothetical protein
MEITACPKCGSKRIEMGTMGAGVTWGVTSWKSVCKDCGYQGEPILFDSEKEYQKFLEGLSKVPTSSTEEEDSYQLSKKDKEVVKLLKEEVNEGKFQEQTPDDGVFPENKTWRNEIIVSLIVAAVGIIVSASGLILSFDVGIAIVYGILLFVFATFICLFIIVIIEYAYLSIKKMSKQKK